MTMNPNYPEVLNAEAEKQKVSTLAAQVRTLARKQAAIRKRIDEESAHIVSAEQHLKNLRADSTSRLESGEYAKFKSLLRRRTEDLEAAREALGLLKQSLPATDAQYDQAVQELHYALVRATEMARGVCEILLRDHLAAVVREQQDFVTAAKALFAAHGSLWTGESEERERLLPRARAFRNTPDPTILVFTTVAEEKIAAGEVAPYLRPPVAPPPPAADVQDAPDAPDAPAEPQTPVQPPSDAPATTAPVPAEAEPTAVERPPTPPVGDLAEADDPLPPEAPLVAVGEPAAVKPLTVSDLGIGRKMGRAQALDGPDSDPAEPDA